MRSLSDSSTLYKWILTEREKNVRQKYHSEVELQAYEKRLTDIEKKIRKLVKRAPDILDEKRDVPSLRVPPKSSNDSSISEDIPVSHRSSSTIRQKTTNDTSEIRTETVDKDSDSSSTSIHQPQSETITTDASDIERRIRASRDQLTRKKTELEKLKQQKKKEDLKKQEDEIKKQLQAYEHEIETLRLQPASPKKQSEQKVSIPSRRLPTTSSSGSSSSSSIAVAAKPQESSIAEDLPASGTSSQSKTNGVEKHVEATRPITTKRRDFFDDEEEEEKKPELKPLETPRDERDTLHDALSVSIATDIAAASSETENDDSRRPSADNLKPALNLNTKAVSPLKSKTDSESSSSTTTATSEKSSKKQSQSSERKPSIIANDYDEDFSEVTHSPANTSKESIVKPKIDNIDIESIQEDLDDKHSSHDTNRSSSSKSSDDEQSEILVLVKKSANTTPRRQDEKTPNDDDFFPSPPPPLPPVTVPQTKIDLSNNNNNNDDTSHDVSDDDDDDEANERIEQEHKVDKLADSILRTFIDEAIGQSKQIQLLKKKTSQNATELTQEAKEWMSDDDSSDEESSKPIIVETNAFDLDFSRLEDKNSDERRVESPRKIVIEEQVKSFVPHTCEQVTQLCHEAIRILIDQNTDFTNRSAIKCQVPNSYFTYGQQDSDNENIRRNRHAYCQMIFDLCIELLHEMYSENIQPAKYPEWQTSKLVPKRFYRGNQPQNRQHIEQFVQTKMLELLNLQPREITYTKWRVSKGAQSGKEKFETVLDEEIRRTESQWITYNDDSTQLKFDIADSIFDQLIQDTITDCLDVADRRFSFSGDSTRL
ncbi:unnamed protein product [Rotaria magnacalcarata]|uniref:DUF4378 domain-containing protein n=2 Tax=Rotaria magnacalcarata TaxID=392030 RepID=A0A815UKI0_9BILA|nr:unnamed protein product [Rotaria magnacalcarata]CAF4127215.1 unnamed protein product [Rotaria magnacalcarata]CAF4172215.1 unnamed protein product [Rotaria magnacalcarata]